MTRHFEQELMALKQSLVEMGTMVNDQLESACAALFGGLEGLASEVIRRDARVDEFDTEIERRCQDIFALAQPVAADLRLLMSALKINNQLERIGDIAVNIAERVEPLMGRQDLLAKTRLGEMAQVARIMVEESLAAFIHNNPSLATRVLESDDVVDDLDSIIFDDMVELMKEDPSLVEPGAHILILSRYIERLADHATNIAEDVIFLVQARLVKHNAGG
jgi:phosphate transport system protein